MKYRELGTSGIRASVVGLGTWVTGGGTIWGPNPDDSESVRAIHAALDAGVDLIDTAPAYGFGRSEHVVGTAIRDRRDEVVLATKCGLLWDDPRGIDFAVFDGHQVTQSLRPDTIREEVEASLARLGTDYIDLYQVHWPVPDTEQMPIADTMACLLELKDEGKIRALGVSNVSLAELKEYMANGRVDAHQLRYSMLFRDSEQEMLGYCADHQLATLTYMSLEQGLLTGKVGMDRQFGKGEWRTNYEWNPWFKLENRARILTMLAGWQELTDKYECDLAQLVIAWTAAQPGVTHVLCGARRQEQAVDNALAGDMQIDPPDLERIRHDIAALGTPA